MHAQCEAHNTQAADQGQRHALQIHHQQNLGKRSVPLQSPQTLREGEPQTTLYDLCIWGGVNPHVQPVTFQDGRKRDKSLCLSVSPENAE